MTRDNIAGYTLRAPDMAIKTRDGRIGHHCTGIESQGVTRAGNGANTMTG